MKKILFILSLVAVTSLTAFAQRPVAGAKGFTLGLQPLTGTSAGPARTGTLLFRYYVADGLAARLSFNYSKLSTKTTDTSSLGYGAITETKNSSGTFAVQLGIQKSLGEGEKLEPYVGADLYFAKSSGKYEARTNYSVGNAAGRTVGDFDEATADGAAAGGGYTAPATSIGFIPMLGFNYFFTENFAIGAEFGWGFVATSSNDNVTETSTSKFGNMTTSTTSYYNTQTSSTSIGTKGNGTITVSVFF